MLKLFDPDQAQRVREYLDSMVEYARQLQFNVKVKTNAVMIREHEAQRLRALGSITHNS